MFNDDRNRDGNRKANKRKNTSESLMNVASEDDIIKLGSGSETTSEEIDRRSAPPNIDATAGLYRHHHTCNSSYDS